MSSTRTHRVCVQPLPDWLDLPRLLGPSQLELSPLADGYVRAEGVLPADAAADLGARLRGLGFGGERVECEVVPPLDRKLVRHARTLDARRRRQTTPGFLRPGVRLDLEGRYSLTPEALALAIGERAVSRGAVRVLDLGCGAGGNTIGFARAGCDVVAVERDPARLALAEHNVALYGVADRVRFVAGDALAGLADYAADLWFVDPPWGQAYDHVRCLLADFPLLQALLAQPARAARLWAKLPPSFDARSWPEAKPSAWFGNAEGDARRVKFLLLEASREQVTV